MIHSFASSHQSKFRAHFSHATYLLSIVTPKCHFSDQQVWRKLTLLDIRLCLSNKFSQDLEIWSERIKLADTKKQTKDGTHVEFVLYLVF